MSDRINISADQFKSDGAFQNDMSKITSVDDIRAAAQALRERAQGHLVYDPSSGQYRAASAPAADSATEREFTKTVEIGGREFTFTASSSQELASLISNAQLVAENVAAPARGEAGRFANSADEETERQQKIYNDSQNELAFRRGEITVKEYLENTGAISEFLEGQGVSIADLQATAQQRDADAYAQDWQQATAIFLAGPGGEWPGGEANKINLQNALISLGLMDADDKVGALVQAYEYMKQHEALIPYEQTTPAATAAVNKALNESSPEEILDVWKKSQQGAGFGSAAEANAAFIATFRK
jgi:hypothetical protein